MSNIKDERTANVSLSFAKIIQFQLESVELENLTRDLSDSAKAEIGTRSGNFKFFFLQEKYFPRRMTNVKQFPLKNL